jgi:hypothetical protein
MSYTSCFTFNVSRFTSSGRHKKTLSSKSDEKVEICQSTQTGFKPMHTPCSPRRMSIKGSCILRKQEESCQATRRPTQVFRMTAEVFGTSNPARPCPPLTQNPELRTSLPVSLECGRSERRHPPRRTHPRGVSSSNANCFGRRTGTTIPMGSPRLIVVGFVSCKRKLAVKAS